MAKSSYRPRTTRRRKRTPAQQMLSLVVLVIVAIIAYWLSQNTNNDPTPTYSADQNEEGFYYYQSLDGDSYYQSTENVIGQALKNELHDIVNEDKNLMTYADVRQALEVVDLQVGSSSALYGIYDGASFPASWDGGATWNREHVWPNSRLGLERVEDYQRNQATDLHNLRASSVSMNSSKSDRFFSEGSGEATTTSDGGFYPGDDHRGDVARIVFYMAVTYDFLVLTDDDLLDESNHYTLEGTKMGKLTLLLEWHKEDPVSSFERERNDRIFDLQGNRNPFIDHPEYVHLIWEDKTIGDLERPHTIAYQDPFLALIEKRRELYDLL